MEIELTRISEKGQVVIPSQIRKKLIIQKSDRFLVFGDKDTVILKRIDRPQIKKTFDEIAEPLRKAATEFGLTKEYLQHTIKEVRKNA